MIKILHVVPALGSGGIEKIIYDYYLHLNRDKFRFDFIVYGDEVGKLEKEFLKMGSNVYHIPPKKKSIYKSLSQMKKIILNGGYDVIHAHQQETGIFPIYYARKANIKTRITHSHIAFREENKLEKLIYKIINPILKHMTTHYFACGLDAGRFLWGNDLVQKNKVFIMNNAIDVKRFEFNQSLRQSIRKSLNIDNKLVIGNVGRFSFQKNHEFLIKIFYEIYKSNKDSVLLLVGEGELEGKVRNLVNSLGIESAVKFVGYSDKIYELLQAMDVFVLPSRYEGLPIAIVESQASGLYSIVSENITKQVKLTDLVHYIPLSETPKYWSEYILNNINMEVKRNRYSDEIIKKGYDINKTVKQLEEIYMSAQTNKKVNRMRAL